MIKLALIGLGSMGKNYFNTLISFKNARIGWLCSQTEQTLDLYPNNFYKTTDYKSLAGKKQIDGVIIATPASTHFKLASFFLKNNIPLLIEKPLTTNYSQALNLSKFHKKIPVLVGHTLLYHPAYLMMKKHLSDLGRIRKITFTGKNDKPRKDTSLVYDWGPHAISLFINLLRKDPIKSKLINSKSDKVHGRVELKYLLTFPDAIKAFLEIGWNSSEKKRRLIIEGTKGLLIFDDFAKSKLTLNNQPLKYDSTPPLTLEIKDFLKALKSDYQPKSGLKFGIKVIRILDALEKLADSNPKRS